MRSSILFLFFISSSSFQDHLLYFDDTDLFREPIKFGASAFCRFLDTTCWPHDAQTLRILESLRFEYLGDDVTQCVQMQNCVGHQNKTANGKTCAMFG